MRALASAAFLAFVVHAAAGLLSVAVAPFSIASAVAAPPASSGAATPLPRPVERAFVDAGIPPSAVAVYVHEVGAPAPLIAHRAEAPMNPASTIKLVTTYAALDLLGPDFTWKTEAHALGTRDGDILHGDLLLRGTGDPKITIERFQELVRSIREAGIREIRGDLIVDRSHFAETGHDPARFDDDPLRTYNVGPDALLTNFKHVHFVLTPDRKRRRVEVRAEPPLPALRLVNKLKLRGGSCGDWKTRAKGAFRDGGDRAEATFSGVYSTRCGEQEWNVSLFDHVNYVHQTFTVYWREAGGVFSGKVREGRVASRSVPVATLVSAPLGEQIVDINKVSNNVMARQVYITLASARYPPPLDGKHSSAVVRDWLAAKGLAFPEMVIENGSGLSRAARISAQSMGRLLLAAHDGPHVPDLVASLPVAAVDGTMRRRLTRRPGGGYAYLKSGSLDDVRAVAGYLFDLEGRRYVVVCFVNHASPAKAGRAIDHLVQWLFLNADDLRAGGAQAPS